MKEFFYRTLHYLKVEWAHHLIYSMAFFLIVLVTVSTLYQIYDIYSLIVDQRQPQASFNKKLAEEEVHKINSKPANLHLFGFKDKNSRAVLNIKWTLRGVILANEMKNNLAIISSSDTDEEVYKKGDILPDGALILDIYFDRALLSIDGSKQILLLWGNKEKNGQNNEDQAKED